MGAVGALALAANVGVALMLFRYRTGDAARTQVFAQADQGADQRVQTIIAQNMGAPAPANAPTGAPAAPAAQRPASVNGNTPAGASHATHAATTTQHAG